MWISLALVIVAFAVSALAFSHLPPIVPVHWGPSGAADQFGSRARGALQIPVAMLAAWIFVGFVPRFDRNVFIKYDQRDSDISTVRPVYGVVVVIVLAFLLAMHCFDVVTALGYIGQNKQPLLLGLLLSIGMIVMGNYIPLVTRRNAFVGYRLPWAYSSAEVWRRTQRAGGYGMVAAGIVGLVGVVLFPSSPVKPIAVAILAQLVLVAGYSYYLAHSNEVH